MDRAAIELTGRLLWLRRRLRARDRWDRERLLAHQAKALRRLRAHAYAGSAFYRSSHAGLEDSPLSELPILTKAQLLDAYDELVTDPAVHRRDLEAFVGAGEASLFRGKYIVVSTSGSTGLPGVFAFDIEEWAHVLASLGRGADWAGLDAGILRRRRVATVGTMSPWHVSNRAAMTLPQWWLPTLRLDASAPIEQLVASLERWRPDMLVTYGSLIGILAAAQLDGRLGIEPQAIMSGADVLTGPARRIGEAAWGARIFEQYDATETAGIASECAAHNGLHLYEDLVIAESVDADGRPVAEGTPGERVLVTVLFGRTLPLIRYELTDGVRLVQGACACGRPFARIDRLEGRAEESLELVGPEGRRVTIHAVVVHDVMDRAGVAAWQVVQEAGQLRVLLAGPDGTGAEEHLVAALREALGRHGATVPPIVVERVLAIDRGPNGKAPLVRAGSR